MEKLKRSIIFFGAIIFLVFAASSASAITDGTGDVYHWNLSDTSWSWGQYSGDRPNIDITDVGYSVSGSDVTITMTVAGTIQTSDTIFYYAYLMSDTGQYFAYYMNGIAMWSGIEGYLGEGGLITTYSATGSTLSITFTPTDPSETFAIYGYAQEFTSVMDMTTSEYWADYAPAIYAPWYVADGDDTTDDDTTDDDIGGDDDGSDTTGGDGGSGGDDASDDNGGLPGFEILLVIVAICVALILLKKKKA